MSNEDLEKQAEQYAKKNYPDEPGVGQFGTGDYEPSVDMSCERERAKEDFIEGAKWQRNSVWHLPLDRHTDLEKVVVIVYPGEHPSISTHGYMDKLPHGNFLWAYLEDLVATEWPKDFGQPLTPKVKENLQKWLDYKV